MGRNLIIVNENTVEFTKYSTFCTTGIQRVKRRVTEKEMNNIKLAISNNDEVGN